MGKNQSASNLTNIVKYDNNGNLTFVSGSTTLLSVSSSGALSTNSTITARTLVVQTVTASVDFITGSTITGTLASNTHQFTGSMFITGSVGINQSNPSYTLDITGTGRFNGNGVDIFTSSGLGTSAASGLLRVVTAGTTSGIAVGQANSSRYTSILANEFVIFNDDASIRTNGAFPISLGTNNTGRLFVTSIGRVGVNTSSPAAIFEVRGTGNTAINSQGNLLVSSGGTATQVADAGGQLSFGAWLNGDLSVPYPVAAIKGVSETATQDINKGALLFCTMNSTTNAERMRLTSGGNLLLTTGVSTGVTDTKFLMISQGTTSSTFAMVIKQSNNSTNLFLVRDDGLFQTGTASGSPFNNTTATGVNLAILSDGTLARSTSSLKYKKNVEDYTKGLAEVMQLRPVTYNSINKTETQTYAGLIAEEVHELGLTEFVQYAEDGSPDALAYQNMVSLLVKAIQELKAEIDELKNSK